MDRDTAGYKQGYKQAYKRVEHNEASIEMKSMLVKVGWKKDMVDNGVPFLSSPDRWVPIF